MPDDLTAYKTTDATEVVGTFATDEIGGKHYPRTKLIIGAEGVNDGDVSAANPMPVTGSVTGSVTADTELPAAAALADDVANPTVPGVGSFLMGWSPLGLEWHRIQVDNNGQICITGNSNVFNVSGNVNADTELPAASQITSDNIAAPTAPSIYGFGMVYDGANWDRMPGSTADGVLVNLGANNDVTVTSGSVTADTELPAAAALSDAIANPTAPMVGAGNMLWTGATWFRAPGTVADGMLVNLGANNDVDTELPAAAALSDTTANPTAPMVGAGSMIWTGAVWVRAPGSIADGQLVNLGANNDVTVTSGSIALTAVVPGVGATNLGKQEDTPHNDGDVGVLMLGIRSDDSVTALGGSNGDYVGFATNSRGNQLIAGPVGHDAAIASIHYPLIAGGYASASAPADVSTDGDAVRAWFLRNGVQCVKPVPHTAGGLSMSKTVSAASTNSTNVKASAGMVYGIQVFNINASARYLKLYNKATAPVVGTDVPVKTLLIPGNTAGGGDIMSQPLGLEFPLGIGFALTTGIDDADTGAVAANELVVNIDYK